MKSKLTMDIKEQIATNIQEAARLRKEHEDYWKDANRIPWIAIAFIGLMLGMLLILTFVMPRGYTGKSSDWW